VIAGSHGLPHRNPHAPDQAGKQNRALDLRAGRWTVEFDLAQSPAGDDHRQVLAGIEREMRAHHREGSCHPTHWTAAEARVADEPAREGTAAQHPGHEARRGAAVSTVQRRLGRHQAGQASPVHAHVVPERRHLGA